MSSEVLTIELSTDSLSALSEIVKEIEKSFNNLAEPLKEIGDMLADAFKPNPLKDFMSTMSDVVAIITGAVALIGAVVVGAISAPVAAIVAAVALVSTIIIANWDSIVAAIKSGIQAIGDFFANLCEGIKTAFSVIVEWFVGVFVAVREGIISAFGTIVEWFGTVWENICNIFSVVVEWFSKMFTTAWEGIVAAFSVAVEWFSGVWEGIVEVFSPVVEWFGGIFTVAWEGIMSAFAVVGQFFGGIWESIKNAFSSVGEFFSRVLQNIKTTLVDGVLSLVGNMTSAGGELIKGLWQGISDKTAWIMNKIKDFCGNIVGEVRTLFGIRSPSQVFAGIGEFMAEGLGVGFGKEMDEVSGNIQKQMRGLLGGAKYAIDVGISGMNRYSYAYAGVPSTNYEQTVNVNFFDYGAKNIASKSDVASYGNELVQIVQNALRTRGTKV